MIRFKWKICEGWMCIIYGGREGKGSGRNRKGERKGEGIIGVYIGL